MLFPLSMEEEKSLTTSFISPCRNSLQLTTSPRIRTAKKFYYKEDSQWNVVWRFVAGITKFRHVDHLKEFSSFFMQCLFEARIIVDFKSISLVEEDATALSSLKNLSTTLL